MKKVLKVSTVAVLFVGTMNAGWGAEKEVIKGGSAEIKVPVSLLVDEQCTVKYTDGDASGLIFRHKSVDSSGGGALESSSFSINVHCNGMGKVSLGGGSTPGPYKISKIGALPNPIPYQLKADKGSVRGSSWKSNQQDTLLEFKVTPSISEKIDVTGRIFKASLAGIPKGSYSSTVALSFRFE